MRTTICLVLATVIALLLPTVTNASPNITLLTENTPPVNYLDKNQNPAGISVELVREMARRVGDPGIIQVVPWARGYKDARELANTALFSTAWSPERDSLFKWVGPLLTKEVVLYKARGNKLLISTLDDARKVDRVGAYRDDSKEQLLIKTGFTNLDSTLDDNANPKKLVAGRIDLWVSTSIQAGPTCVLAGINPLDIEPTLTLKKQLMYLAFSTATDDAVVAKWQQAFDAMMLDGTVKKIHLKYGLPANNLAPTEKK